MKDITEIVMLNNYNSDDKTRQYITKSINIIIEQITNNTVAMGIVGGQLDITIVVQ